MSMSFCRDCGNMLYPMEDNNQLMQVCRTCPFRQQADEYRVHYNVVSAEGATEMEDLQPDNITADPTLPRARVRCRKCGGAEAVWFQSAEAEEKMVLTFICLSCHTTWIG